MKPCLTRTGHQTDHGPVSVMTKLCGWTAAVSAMALAALVASVAPARADTVTDWNAYASTAIVVTAGQPPPVAVLSFAMVQGAVYDAVNAIDRGHRSYLPQPPPAAGASEDAAAATAAPDVLVWLFPLQQSTLDGQYETSLAAIPDTPPGARRAGSPPATPRRDDAHRTDQRRPRSARSRR